MDEGSTGEEAGITVPVSDMPLVLRLLTHLLVTKSEGSTKKSQICQTTSRNTWKTSLAHREWRR